MPGPLDWEPRTDDSRSGGSLPGKGWRGVCARACGRSVCVCTRNPHKPNREEVKPVVFFFFFMTLWRRTGTHAHQAVLEKGLHFHPKAWSPLPLAADGRNGWIWAKGAASWTPPPARRPLPYVGTPSRLSFQSAWRQAEPF